MLSNPIYYPYPAPKRIENGELFVHFVEIEFSTLKYPAFIRYTKEKYYEAYRKFFWLLNQERQ